MILPDNKHLKIENLSSVFKSTTNSYKFYWFLAILESIKSKGTNPRIEDLIIEMIANVWYPINYFKLSFGKQDQFDFTIKKILKVLKLPKDIKKDKLINVLKENKNTPPIEELIKKLTKYVPYRFMRPWFLELRGIPDSNINKKIVEFAIKNYDDNCNPSLYKFGVNESIEINSIWLNYLIEHLGILTEFTYWNLNLYLQKRNPNVANIPIKLFPPTKRDLSKAREYWNLYLSSKNGIGCIYSDELISQNDFSVDHFIPWSFTGHDQVWNLVPTTKSINSSKSDNIPSKEYLESFVNLQYDAFHTVLKSGRNKIFEDYSMLFNLSISEIEKIEKEIFLKKIEDSIKPQMQIARNMGFKAEWKYVVL